jgi:hypothetical protein
LRKTEEPDEDGSGFMEPSGVGAPMRSGGIASRKFVVLAEEDFRSSAGLGDWLLLLVQFSTMEGSSRQKKIFDPGVTRQTRCITQNVARSTLLYFHCVSLSSFLPG